MSKKTVLLVNILNPQPGGKRYTTQKCADNYVSRGWAEWRGRSIYFPETEARRIEKTGHLLSAERRRLADNGESWHWRHGISGKATVVVADRETR